MQNIKYRMIVAASILSLLLVLFLAIPARTLAEAQKPAQATRPKDENGAMQSTPIASSKSCDPYCKERQPETSIPSPTAEVVQIDYEPGVVKALLFWMEGCPHCIEVKTFTIPKLEKAYGDKLQVRQIELKSISEVDTLFFIGSKKGYMADQVGVPFLMIGEDILIGSDEIPQKLPVMIEKYEKLGGVGYPDMPELAAYLPVSTPIPPIRSNTPPAFEQEATATLQPDSSTSCNDCNVFDMEVLSVTLTTIAQNLTKTPFAPTPQPARSTIPIYLFWGDGCPHCEEAKPFLQELDQASREVELHMYEVWYVEDNRELLTKMAAAYGFEPNAVPTIFIGNQHWEGYNNQIREEIQSAVNACFKNGCPDAGAGIIPGIAAAEMILAPGELDPTGEPPTERKINIPLVGSIDLSTRSLLISTLLISFVDGFNPCSIWALTMLLALTLHSGSRKKVLLIGLVFLTVTAWVYALFIAGLFTMFTVVSFVGWVQVVVAAVALFFSMVNIKDYFWFREGISLTIADDRKKGIFQRIRRIMAAGQSFWGLVGGTIVLAGGVSLVEFSCTAGFPMLWTNLLVSQNVSASTFILLLLVYLLIYQLDEMGIFLVAVYSMRASKLEEKHGRILKLIGGMLMLVLAGMMLVDPSLMNNLASSLTIFGIAFAATLIVLLVHRTILPRMGIRLGTEFNKKPAKK